MVVFDRHCVNQIGWRCTTSGGVKRSRASIKWARTKKTKSMATLISSFMYWISSVLTPERPMKLYIRSRKKFCIFKWMIRFTIKKKTYTPTIHFYWFISSVVGFNDQTVSSKLIHMEQIQWNNTRSDGYDRISAMARCTGFVSDRIYMPFSIIQYIVWIKLMYTIILK